VLGGHLPGLDGLRGVAILMVLVLHFTLYGGMQASASLDQLFYRLAIIGWIGVDLFFVLSGFLITGILYDTKGSRHFFRNFYARRSLRIFPLYYFALFVFCVVLPRLAPASPDLVTLAQQSGWYWSYLVNLKVTLEGWSSNGLLEHFWSLSVEEQFYLVWPVALFFLRRRALIGLCLASLAVSLIVRLSLVQVGQSVAAYALTPARLDTLAIGALLALVARGPDGLASLRRWAGPAAGIAAFGLAILIVWRRGLEADDSAVQVIGYPLLAALFGALLSRILTQSPASPLSRIMASAGLRFFGRYSYALYVIHHPLVFFLRRQGISVYAWPKLFGLQLPAQLVFIVFATGLALAGALLSWHLYELPFLKLKRLFPYDRVADQADPTCAV
jgi:peptidoglycan/LPS O-acetylase OafA/YrhL